MHAPSTTHAFDYHREGTAIAQSSTSGSTALFGRDKSVIVFTCYIKC